MKAGQYFNFAFTQMKEQAVGKSAETCPACGTRDDWKLAGIAGETIDQSLVFIQEALSNPGAYASYQSRAWTRSAAAADVITTRISRNGVAAP